MPVNLTKRVNISDDLLEEFISKKVGDGKKNVFIEENNFFKEMLSYNLLDISKELSNNLGEFEIDGIKVMKKLGAVYLANKENKMQNILSMIPSLEYTKGDITTSTLEHMCIYNQYNLTLEYANKKYDFVMVQYTESL